jgi:hypothetical protein
MRIVAAEEHGFQAECTYRKKLLTAEIAEDAENGL